MFRVTITPPDGTAWSIEPVALADGVGLVIGFDLAGEPATLTLGLDRVESRDLAHGILAAGGDALARTLKAGEGSGA